MDNKTNDIDIVVLKFADSAIPIFKEVRNKDYILYCEKNDYPEYLTYLYNKSAKHNAIINGKCNYIIGGGFEGKENEGAVNRNGETMYDIWVKSVKDIEIYGGFRWIMIWSLGGTLAEIYHDDFYKFRKGKNGGYFWKGNWSDSREEATVYPDFDDTNRAGVQVFAYNEYRPGCDHYPLPGYVGCNNYIDVDIEISKFHLSAIRNGLMPSKMIQFYTGEPADEKKAEIERRLTKKFAGSEKAGSYFLVFNTSKDKTVEITDLSATELDKQFDILNKTCQQEIFTGHQVTSPMLFGIKTEGQLGGTNELKIAYEIFINTYAKPKQSNIEKITNYFCELMGRGNDWKISQLDPVGIIIDIKDVIQQIPKEFIYDKLGIPAEYREPVAPVQQPGMPGAIPTEQAAVNDNLKNLTGKQHQQLMRVIRQYTRGKMTKEAATVLLRTSLGLSDEDIEMLLGEQDPAEFSAQPNEDDVIELFSACGDLKRDFQIIKSKRVNFSLQDAAEDELHFKQLDITQTEANILDLIQKDKRITAEVIAITIDSDKHYVEGKIKSLEKRGLIVSIDTIVGSDVVTERSLPTPLGDIKPPDLTAETTEILIKYSYEGPRDDKNRKFCRKLLDLDRLYSRSEIERISERLGYSVWDRRGGWWGDSPTCRHNWTSNIIVKKKRR
jgi:DNA-binding Lrp family transcriptional regulator